MPTVMEKSDWMKTVANASRAENIWYEMVSGSDSDVASIILPKVDGVRRSFQVILVPVTKGERAATRPRKTSARGMLSEFAGSERRKREKSAWSEAVKDKYAR